MRFLPTALGYVPDASDAPDWERAQVRRLARRLGYVLIWLPDDSLVPVVDQVRASDADAVITMTPTNFDVLTLHALMCVADVETVCPRESFARWAVIGAGA